MLTSQLDHIGDLALEGVSGTLSGLARHCEAGELMLRRALDRVLTQSIRSRWLEVVILSEVWSQAKGLVRRPTSFPTALTVEYYLG